MLIVGAVDQHVTAAADVASGRAGQRRGTDVDAQRIGTVTGQGEVGHLGDEFAW